MKQEQKFIDEESDGFLTPPGHPGSLIDQLASAQAALNAPPVIVRLVVSIGLAVGEDE